MRRFRVGGSCPVAVAITMWIGVAVAASGPVSAGDRIGVPGQGDTAAGSLVVVPIEAGADRGIVSASFGLEYSTDLLTPLAVHKTRRTSDFDLAFDLDTPGELSITLRGPRPLLGEGAIAWVVFRSHGAAGDRTELTLHDGLLNGIDAATLDHGWLALGSGEVTLSFATDLTAPTGELFTAALTATDTAGILAMDIRIEYDPAVIQAVGVARTPISQSFTLTVNLNTPGLILISLFGTQALVGAGPVLDIDFNVVGSVGQSTPIDLVSASINEGGIASILEDGLFVVCDDTDFDGDGVSLCDGDCDDDDNGRFPGNPEIGCDGVDQDCDDLTSDILDGDGDTFACDVDCDDEVPEINPDALEVCDGVDNDCDFGIDNVPPPVELVHLEGVGAPGTAFSWAAVADATGYDVLRGRLSTLRSSGGDFSQATDTCLGDDVPDPFIDDTETPPVSDAFWYLVRPTNCGGGGSYESGGTAQAGLRDPEANASPESCN